MVFAVAHFIAPRPVPESMLAGFQAIQQQALAQGANMRLDGVELVVWKCEGDDVDRQPKDFVVVWVHHFIDLLMEADLLEEDECWEPVSFDSDSSWAIVPVDMPQDGGMPPDDAPADGGVSPGGISPGGRMRNWKGSEVARMCTDPNVTAVLAGDLSIAFNTRRGYGWVGLRIGTLDAGHVLFTSVDGHITLMYIYGEQHLDHVQVLAGRMRQKTEAARAGHFRFRGSYSPYSEEHYGMIDLLVQVSPLHQMCFQLLAASGVGQLGLPQSAYWPRRSFHISIADNAATRATYEC